MVKDKKRFTVLFPNSTNVSLVKDVGQIPLILGRDYDYDVCIASCYINNDGKYLDQFSEYLRIDKLKKPFNNEKLSCLLYLLKNAKRIDWLNLYHCSNYTYWRMMLYKILNPKGKIYLKLDMDYRMVRRIHSSNHYKSKFVRCTNVANVVSVETRSCLDMIQKFTKKRIELIPNGFCSYSNESVHKEDKENVFLTVGRLGTEQKATEIILEAFSIISDKCDYSLRLVGSIEQSFQKYIDDFFSKHPHLTERINFVGSIEERSMLDYEYRRAKVFVLPSRWESFGLVLPEALAKSCRIIVSNEVPSADEVTHNGDYGCIVKVNDAKALSDAMIDCIQDEFEDEEMVSMHDYAIREFSWGRICGKLDELMKNAK